MKFGLSQWSVLGSKPFTVNPIPVGRIARSHDLSFHLFGDDTDLYLGFKPVSSSRLQNVPHVSLVMLLQLTIYADKDSVKCLFRVFVSSRLHYATTSCMTFNKIIWTSCSVSKIQLPGSSDNVECTTTWHWSSKNSIAASDTESQLQAVGICLQIIHWRDTSVPTRTYNSYPTERAFKHQIWCCHPGRQSMKTEP